MATRTVLVVDDEPDDLQQMQKALEAEGYFVLLAEDYDSAMRMFETHQASIDLLLTDIAIPGDNGCELAKAVLSVRPEIQVLLVSGFKSSDLLARVQEVLGSGESFPGFAPDQTVGADYRKVS